MRIPGCASLLLLLLSLVSTAQARDGEFQFTPRLGLGLLDIREPPDQEFESGTFGTLQFGISVGYKTPFGLVAEVGIDSQGEIDTFGLFDATELLEVYASVGYQLDIAGWRLVPKIGRSVFGLDIEPGLIRNGTGSFEGGTPIIRGRGGVASFFEVALSRRVAERVNLGVNYRDGQDFAFGRVRSLSVMLSLGIK